MPDVRIAEGPKKVPKCIGKNYKKPDMRVKLNVQGLLGIAAIAFMVGVVFAKQWNIPWLYFGASVLFYCGAVIALSVWQEEEKGKQETLRHELAGPKPAGPQPAGPHQRETLMVIEEINESKVVMFTLFRALLGCHLAFALQALGILVDMGGGESVVVRIGYFLASLAIGLTVPFLLLSRREERVDGAGEVGEVGEAGHKPAGGAPLSAPNDQQDSRH